MSFSESLSDIVAGDRSGLLAVADHWERVRLGDIARVVNGFPFPSDNFTPDRGVPLLRIRDVRSDRTEAFFDGEVGEAFLVQAGELVVGMDGDFHAALWLGPQAALNQRVCKIVPDETSYSVKFLAYVLPGYLNAINQATSSITVKHLSSRTVGDIPIPLPPRKEQDRLVAAIEEHLSQLDAAVAGLKRVQAQLPRYRAGVLKAAFEGTLLGRDGGAAGDWPIVPLRELAELKGGITKGQRRKAGTTVREVPYLRVANVQRGYLDLRDVKTIEATEDEIVALALRKGDVLFNEGGDRDKLGRGWVWNTELPLCIHQNHVFRARVQADRLHPKFLSWYANSAGQRYFLEQGKQTTNLASVSLTKLGALPIPIPPIDTQRQIVAEVERRVSILDATFLSVSSRLTKAHLLRLAILRRAFSGQLVSQDPNDESPSVLLERILAARAAAPIKPARR